MVGIDEVGRGCLAGPLLVVAAKPLGKLPDGLTDSKMLSRLQRESFYELLLEACQFGEGWVSPVEIDRGGLARAMRLGVARALRELSVSTSDEIIMDGPINYLPGKFASVNCLINADGLVPLVSAASIYAKVRRDSFMRQLQKRYPAYGFEHHVGYGTPAHLLVLARFGALPKLHRMSFQPLRNLEAI